MLRNYDMMQCMTQLVGRQERHLTCKKNPTQQNSVPQRSLLETRPVLDQLHR